MSTPIQPRLKTPACEAMTPITAIARTPSSAGNRTGRLDAVAAAAALSRAMTRPSVVACDIPIGLHRAIAPGLAAETADDAGTDVGFVEGTAAFESAENTSRQRGR